MPDREKVFEGLEAMREFFGFGLPSQSPVFEAYQNILTDALELLKELDPVETELEGGGYNWWHVCGDCHGAINQNDNYCKHCGRRIKHEKKAE